MGKRITSILVLLFLTGFAFSQSWAGEPTTEELLKEIKALKTRVAGLEKRFSRQESKLVEQTKVVRGVKESLIKYVPGEGVEIEAAGLRIGADATFIFQGTPNANNAGSGEDSILDASYKACVEIEKEFDDWGLAFMELEAGQNDTIESELSLFSNVNAAAADSSGNIAIAKVFYEHYFFDRQLTLTCGKIDALDYMEQNEYRDDDKTQFLTGMFKHSPVIEGPSDNTLGLHALISLEPIQFLEFEGGIYETDADWDDIFDHMFYAAQVNVKPAELLGADAEQWGGNYRFYAWINDRFHEKLIDENDPATDDTKEMSYGFGISCDQMVTDVFGIFGSFAWQRPDILPAGATAATVADNPTLEWSWSAGAQMAGLYWNREDDVLGFAVGQVFPSEEWDDASSDAYGAGEGHIEAYYKCQLNECLAISPDIQIIWHPNGVRKESEGDDDTIFVYGVRAQVDF